MAYGSDNEFSDWLAAMGLSLPTDPAPPSLAILRQIGTSYLDGVYGTRYSGNVSLADQPDEWPRDGAFRGNTPLPPASLPQAIIHASYFAAYYAANNPEAFFGGGAGSELISQETIGPLTTKYAVPTNPTPEQLVLLQQVTLPFVDGLVAPFLLEKGVNTPFLLSVGPNAGAC